MANGLYKSNTIVLVRGVKRISAVRCGAVRRGENANTNERCARPKLRRQERLPASTRRSAFASAVLTVRPASRDSSRPIRRPGVPTDRSSAEARADSRREWRKRGGDQRPPRKSYEKNWRRGRQASRRSSTLRCVRRDATYRIASLHPYMRAYHARSRAV